MLHAADNCRCDVGFLAEFSSPIGALVEHVEDAGDVEDLFWEYAGLMRVGTSIAHKAQGFHSGFLEVCGNGGKSGWVESGWKRDFQFP